MRIAIIGAGDVGGTLGAAWAKRGHDVFFGVRDPADAKLKELLARAGTKARHAGVGDAVASAEVIALTVPGPRSRTPSAPPRTFPGRSSNGWVPGSRFG